MGKFNWWRRFKKKRPLTRKQAFKGKSFLLQQIEHGDYDYSDYRRQALLELEWCKNEQEKIAAKWLGGPLSLQDKLDQVYRKYIKRYNRLMEDHDNLETKLLFSLKESLILEFGIDVWDQALDFDWEQDLKQFYHNYKTIAQNESTRSKKTPTSEFH